MVLSSKQVRRRMELDVKDQSSLIITPLLQQKDAVDLDSVDLRLGSYFILPQVTPEPAVLPSKRFAGRSQLKVHVPLGKYLVVPAHQTVLGATMEFIKLPYDVSGQILTKSSIARTFMVIETAPWIHPYYRGCLTLEIANVSNSPLLLYPGRLIGQLILMEISDPVDLPKLQGTYVGPVFPEHPPFNDPEDDLVKIGVAVDDVIVPIFGRV